MFRNVIACEDVREEVRNKKSLMGILAGDIVVDEMPANVQLAFYIEFVAPTVGSHDLQMRLLQDDKEIMRAEAKVVGGAEHKVAIIVLPRAFVVFEAECDLILKGAFDGGDEVEILRKVIRLRPGPIGSSLPSSLSPTDVS